MTLPAGSVTNSPAWLHYAEAKDEAGRAALRQWLDTLPRQSGFVGAELLLSPDQPELTLVASRWAILLTEWRVPEGVRAWVFQVIDSR